MPEGGRSGGGAVRESRVGAGWGRGSAEGGGTPVPGSRASPRSRDATKTPGRRPLFRAAARLGAVPVLVLTLVLGPTGAAWGVPWPPTVRAAATCTGWPSDSVPPTTIRVRRTTGPASGSVQVVPFHEYVNVVMAAEWGASAPAEALKAGAVAVKEYAWYHAMFWRGGSAVDGSCYDVVDSTLDQVYAPETRAPVPTQVAAVDATWGISIRRTQGLFSTHYDAGANVPCGANANGWQLFQVSAAHCARDGMAAVAILQTYFGPGLQVVGASPDPAGATALSFRAQPSQGTAGVPFPVQPIVAIVDAAGQTVTGGTSSVAAVSLALAPSSPGALLTCTGGLSRTAVAGLATFEGCQLSAAASGAVLVASTVGLPAAGTPPFAVEAPAPAAAPPVPSMTLEATGSVTPGGMDVQLSVELVPTGPRTAGVRTVHLEQSIDGVAWTPLADLTTDATGTAGVVEQPTANALYRVVFDGAPDMGPATSPVVRVQVPRVVLLRPDNHGAVRRVSRGTPVSFATLVRPMQASAAPGDVQYRLAQLVGNAWVTKRSWTVSPDPAGWARLRVTFSSRGKWSVRSRALSTPTNASSAWSPAQRYDVR